MAQLTLSRVQDKSTQVYEMARRLRQASRAGHWEALRVIDRELAALLPSLGTSDTWSKEMARAMESLQTAHRDAFARCVDASEHIAKRLSAMQIHKDGWLAYAANSEWNGNTNP